MQRLRQWSGVAHSKLLFKRDSTRIVRRLTVVGVLHNVLIENIIRHTGTCKTRVVALTVVCPDT